MKKKLFRFALTFVFILTGTICLTACGGTAKYYYTEDMPEHCEIVFPGRAWDDGGFYVLDGEKCDFRVNIEEGYCVNDFKLYINSTELIPTDTEINPVGDYVVAMYFSFTPTVEFEITATGNFAKIVKQLTMSKTDWYDETNANNSELFIRFQQNSFGLPTEETVYSTFVKTKLSNNFTESMSFGEILSFDVYYKGTEFSGNPNVAYTSSGYDSVFYHENGEIGYHFTYTQEYENANLTFGNYTASRNMSIIISENSGFGSNLVSDKLDITLPETDSRTVTITLKNHANIPTDVLSGLKLVINGENQNIDFTDKSTNGVFEMTVKNPWEYGELYDASYEIDLNFYEFDYFNGVV